MKPTDSCASQEIRLAIRCMARKKMLDFSDTTGPLVCGCLLVVLVVLLTAQCLLIAASPGGPLDPAKSNKSW